MVQELRRIILDCNELTAALECYQRLANDFLPDTKILNCRTSGEKTVEVKIQTLQADAEPTTIQLTPEDLLFPMIRFCIEGNIMLPRDGGKTVMIGEDKVALCIALNSNIHSMDIISRAPGRINTGGKTK